jgi:hypothetical protein
MSSSAPPRRKAAESSASKISADAEAALKKDLAASLAKALQPGSATDKLLAAHVKFAHSILKRISSGTEDAGPRPGSVPSEPAADKEGLLKALKAAHAALHSCEAVRLELLDSADSFKALAAESSLEGLRGSGAAASSYAAALAAKRGAVKKDFVAQAAGGAAIRELNFAEYHKAVKRLAGQEEEEEADELDIIGGHTDISKTKCPLSKKLITEPMKK